MRRRRANLAAAKKPRPAAANTAIRRKEYPNHRPIPQSSLTPFPPVLRTKMTVGFQMAIGDGVNDSTGNVFNSSLFDPTGALGARQPKGFDQLCASAGPYNDFLVESVTTTAFVTKCAAGEPGLLWIMNTPSSPTIPTLTTAELAMETRSLVFKPYCDNFTTPPSVMTTVRTADVLNVRNIADDADLRGTYSANPAKFFYITVGVTATGIGPVHTSGTVLVIGKLEFEVQFLNRPILPVS